MVLGEHGLRKNVQTGAHLAIGFAHCEIIHAAAGSSVVGLSAYIARDSRQDLATGDSYSFGHKNADLIDTGVVLPDGADTRFSDSELLWGAAMAAETTFDRQSKEVRFKKGAQVAKHIVLALPKECTDAERRDLTVGFVGEEFVRHGVAAEWAIHAPDGDNGNWHAHLLVSTRKLEGERFGKKCQEINPSFARGGDGRRFVSEDDRLTERWAEAQTRFFKERGLGVTVDPYGSKLAKQEHLGPTWHMTDSRKAASQSTALAQAEDKARRDPAAVLEAVTQRKATFTLREVERALRKAGLAGDDFEQARTAVLMHPELVPLARREDDGGLTEIDRFTTRAVRRQEREAMETAGRVAARRRRVPMRAVEAAAGGRTLDGEQRAALDHACGPAGLALIEGRAGAGKSYTMGAIREAHERGGYRVIGLAPTNTVAQDLRAASGAGIAQTATVHLALLRQEKGREPAWDDRTALLVDEAAMLDARTMGRLLARADQCGAKVILVGDDRQLASVERGGLFAEMRERYGAAEIRDIRRQAEDWQRQASRDFSEGRIAEGLTAYDRRGFVRWEDRTEDAKAALVADWAQAQRERPEAVRFIYASTNREVDDLNRRCRALRVARGEVEAGERFQTVRGELAAAAGDRLQFYGNDRKAGIYNGTVGTVVSAGRERIAVRLDGGEVVSFDPAKFDRWGHGYAGTVYRGQGKTQLEVLALYDNPAGWNARAAYVGMTRHKAEVRLYVGRDMAANLEVLARRMSRADDVGASLRYEELPASAVKPRIGASTVAKAPDPWAALDLSGASAAVERAVQAGRKPEPAAAHEKSRAAFERCLRDIAALTEDGLVAPPSMVEDRKRLYEAFRSDLKALSGRQPQTAWGVAVEVEKAQPEAAKGLRRDIAAGIAKDKGAMLSLKREAPDAAQAIEKMMQRQQGVRLGRGGFSW